MKIMHCTAADFDVHGDWLVAGAEQQFRAGGYTHTECDGYVNECEVCEAGVMVGEQVADPTPPGVWPAAMEVPGGYKFLLLRYDHQLLRRAVATDRGVTVQDLHRTDDFTINQQLVCRIYRAHHRV